NNVRRCLAETLTALDHAGIARADRALIHGDFTTLNVIADQDTCEPVGLIDFAHARVDTAALDLGFCLWQSGRSHFADIALDTRRVTALVAGYHEERPLPEDS